MFALISGNKGVCNYGFSEPALPSLCDFLGGGGGGGRHTNIFHNNL